MNKIKYLCLILLISCGYEPTILEYNPQTTELYIISDTADTYIKRFEIEFSDSIVFNYPIKSDEKKRNKINLADYFEISHSKINNLDTIRVYIRSGVKTTGNAFDVCDEEIILEKKDTTLILKCLAR